jgi:lambda family phage portal protein
MIDRFIAAVSPVTALKREVARARLNVINSGYSESGANRMKKSLAGWKTHSSSPDEDITWNLTVLRERSRSLYMGTPIATGVLKTTKTNVVGAGLRLNSQINAQFLGLTDEQADAWEGTAEREFSLWANSKDCDAARTSDWGQLQQLAFLSALMSGDVFALLPMIPRKNSPYDLRVQLIEADRVCNPLQKADIGSFQAGIEVGDYGEPIRYHISKFYPWALMTDQINTWTAVEAFGAKTGRRNVIHLMDAERPGQRRGVPMLAPVIESLKQLGRYTDAELMAAVVSGMFTVAITSASPGGGDVGEMNSIPTDQQSQYQDTADIALGNGSVVSLAPGEQVQTINPGRPNAAFDPFVLSILRQVGAALEVPMELLVKHFTASYSASRAALLEAWKFFRRHRAWLAADFCQPIYEEWLAEAVARGRISAPGFFSDPAIRAAYCGAEWNGPSAGQLDPLKEVNAAVVRVQHGFSTRAKETAELTGGDWGANYRQRVIEERMMRDGGLIIPTAIRETLQDQNVDGIPADENSNGGDNPG